MEPPTEGTVVITGASSGIGRAMARRLAAEARRIVLVARRGERLEALAAELRQAHRAVVVEVRACDLRDLAQVESLADDLLATGPVDVLVNNAGVGDRSLFEDGQWPKLEQVIALNVTALTYLTRRVVPGMVAQGRGGILNVGSILGVVPGIGSAVYAATKHYVAGFSESLRAELAGTGVVVTQVQPGPVDTDFVVATTSTLGDLSERRGQISAERCSAEALRGFRRGRAIVRPGRWNALAILAWSFIALLVPGVLRHAALAWWGARVRARRDAASS